MNTLSRMAAAFTLAAILGAPLTALAQSTPAPQQGAATSGGAEQHEHHRGRRHRDPFLRALHKLTLSDQQKQQIKSAIAANKKASENATPDQRKANWQQLHTQIEALLTPAQQQQLKTELARMKAMRESRESEKGEPKPAAAY